MSNLAILNFFYFKKIVFLRPLNFEYTYITLLGFKLYEPVTILTNFTIVYIGLFGFFRFRAFNNPIAQAWSLAFLFVSLGNFLSAVTHGIHEQLGDSVLRGIWYLSNAASLVSVYFFYRATFVSSTVKKDNTMRNINYLASAWVVILLLIILFLNDFVLVKVHAGIVMVYSLFVHAKSKNPGSGFIAIGIAISFLSIVVHSLKLSFSDWFNYKDIAHVIMLTSLILFYKGIRKTISSEELNFEPRSI